MSAKRYLSIYLRDHHAGAQAGLELARRTAGSNEDGEYGRQLRELCTEIEEDREILTELMDRLGIRANPIKQGGAWVGEKLGRLKLNGQITEYSPLSRLVEIEGLVIGVSGKLELWRSLHAAGAAGELEDIDLDRMIERAESQRRRLQELHDRAAAEALS